MTAKETDLLVTLIDTNAKANEQAHIDIIRRLDDMKTDMKTTLTTLSSHCAERQKIVDAALLKREQAVDAAFATRDKAMGNGFAALAPKKYTAYQVVKSMGKMAMLILAQAAVTVGILAAVGVFE